MASTLVLASQNHWLVEDLRTTWNFSFVGGYLRPEHVKAYKRSPTGTRTDLTFTLVTESSLLLPEAVNFGYTLVIYRDSSNGGLPLVDFQDGARITEVALDTIAKQALFVGVESSDNIAATLDFQGQQYPATYIQDYGGVAIDAAQLGYKALKPTAYVGDSQVVQADNGKAHLKTVGSNVLVNSAVLSSEFMTTIINHKSSTLLVTFQGAQAWVQGGPQAGVARSTVTVSPYSTITIARVNSTTWYVSGVVQ